MGRPPLRLPRPLRPHRPRQVRLEAPRLTAALTRLRGSRAVLTRPARATPFAFPLLVEIFRESLTTEALETRVARMVAELEAGQTFAAIEKALDQALATTRALRGKKPRSA